MPAKVILNPYSGRWKALRLRPAAEAALKAAGVEYTLTQTDAPGHATQLAAEAVRAGLSPIIAAGGDGTISEVVNGMQQARPEDDLPPLGIMPLGTANDLVVNLSMAVELPAAAERIARGALRRIDLGRVSFDASPAPRFFDNNSAVGLEPTITIIQQQIKRLGGIVRYLLATLRGIARNPVWTVEIAWEGGEYRGKANLVTVGINPLTGGLFYMTPHAKPDDGLLTFVYGHMATRLEILRLLPRTMKPGPGSYVEHPSIHEIHSPWVTIRLDQPTPLHADGEIQSETVRELSYSILPGRLPILS